MFYSINQRSHSLRHITEKFHNNSCYLYCLQKNNMSQFSDYNFSGTKVLLRVDFNVPLDKQTLAITDDTRMTAAIPTIKKILADGGSVIVMSHLGRPKGGPEDKYSLRHIVSHLSDLLGEKDIQFAEDCIGE